MTTFLAWIYAQAYKFYDWFGSSYDTLKNAAANAWNWAVTKANEAYNNARSYAYNLLNSYKVTVNNSINWLEDWIADVYDGLREDITGLFDWVEYKFSQVKDFAVDAFWDAIDAVKQTINNVKNNLTSIINNGLDLVRAWVTNAYGWLLTLRDSITKLIQTFTPAKISELFAMLDASKKQALLFFDNPVIFIFDLIQDKILDFLDYVIAWGLGTVKYDLPTERPWRK
jgi:phage-related protein